MGEMLILRAKPKSLCALTGLHFNSSIDSALLCLLLTVIPTKTAGQYGDERHARASSVI